MGSSIKKAPLPLLGLVSLTTLVFSSIAQWGHFLPLLPKATWQSVDAGLVARCFLGVHAWEGRSAQVEVDDQRRSWGVRDQVKDEEADNILQRDLPDPWQSRSPRKKEVTQQRRILGVLYLLGTCTRL